MGSGMVSKSDGLKMRCPACQSAHERYVENLHKAVIAETAEAQKKTEELAESPPKPQVATKPKPSNKAKKGATSPWRKGKMC